MITGQLLADGLRCRDKQMKTGRKAESGCRLTLLEGLQDFLVVESLLQSL